MSERSRASAHLARALEELLRAAAESAASLAERSESGTPPGGVTRLLERWLGASQEPTLDLLREVLRSERARWEARAPGDPAAARLRDLFAAALIVVGDTAVDATRARAARAGGRRAAPRTPQARAASSRRPV